MNKFNQIYEEFEDQYISESQRIEESLASSSLELLEKIRTLLRPLFKTKLSEVDPEVLRRGTARMYKRLEKKLEDRDRAAETQTVKVASGRNDPANTTIEVQDSKSIMKQLEEAPTDAGKGKVFFNTVIDILTKQSKSSDMTETHVISAFKNPTIKIGIKDILKTKKYNVVDKLAAIYVLVVSSLSFEKTKAPKTKKGIPIKPFIDFD